MTETKYKTLEDRYKMVQTHQNTIGKHQKLMGTIRKRQKTSIKLLKLLDNQVDRSVHYLATAAGVADPTKSLGGPRSRVAIQPRQRSRFSRVSLSAFLLHQVAQILYMAMDFFQIWILFVYLKPIFLEKCRISL